MQKINLNEIEYLDGYIGIHLKSSGKASEKLIIAKAKDNAYTYALNLDDAKNTKKGQFKTKTEAFIYIKKQYFAKWFKTKELINEWLKTDDI